MPRSQIQGKKRWEFKASVSGSKVFYYAVSEMPGSLLTEYKPTSNRTVSSFYCVGSQTLRELPRLLGRFEFPGTLFLVADEMVFSLYGKKVLTFLKEGGYHPEVFLMKGRETSKNLQTAEVLYQKIALKGARRDTPLLALGGGVTTDLAGFVASTFMRGVPLVLIPTTLLAQADAAIGGKTAVNLPQGKNLVGTFYHPKFVLIDSEFLKTLPQREFRNGLAEMVKMCILEGEKEFRDMERFSASLQDSGSGALLKLLNQSIAGKLSVVSRDPEERKGERMKLNLGHTFAHALESATRYKKYTHGEAVSIGMMGACYLAENTVNFSPRMTLRVAELLTRFKLPVSYAGVSEEAILSSMSQDKKKKESLRFVLPKLFGNVAVREGIPERLVLKVLKQLKGKES